MYFAGATTLHKDGTSFSKQESLNFPIRLPLERLLTNATKEGLPTPQVDVVAAGVKHILVSVGGVVYGMGMNTSLQLGSKMPPSMKYFRDLQLSVVLGPNNAVTQIACGRKHTLLLTEKGEVYSCGDNTFKQLGRSNRHTDWAPVRVANSKVVSIACGPETSFALTSDGNVYSWGRTDFNNLGHPSDMYETEHPVTMLPICVPIEVPTRIEAFHSRHLKIVEIAVGDEHFVARTDTEVFSCGNNTFGRLGLGDTNDRVLPHRVTFPTRKQPEKLLQIAAGQAHTIVTRHNQDFGVITYIFGREGSTLDGTIAPRLLHEAPLNIERVFCGWGSTITMAVTDDGKLFNWGAHTHCPPLMLLNDAARKLPSRVEVLDNIRVKSCCCTGGCFLIVCADVAASGDAVMGSVMVPYERRLGVSFNKHMVGTDLYDKVRANFLREFLGAADGAAYIATIQNPPPAPEAVKMTINKVGASKLNVGSKVRLWMQDVYAVGKITSLDPLAVGSSPNLKPPGTPKKGGLSDSTPPPSPLLQAAKRTREASQFESQASGLLLDDGTAIAHRGHHFEVTWARDDWVPEIIELYSDDETLNEENPNRWQKVWFLEPPAGVSVLNE